MAVLVLCNDLFFGTQLTSAIKRAEMTPLTCLGMKTCLDRLNDEANWVIIDLELPGLDLAQIVAAKPDGCKLIAFGPHVHVDKLEAAVQAGVDMVLSRGQIASGLEEILQSSG